MADLVLHAVDPGIGRERVLCGQLKMRTKERRRGLRYTARWQDVTCLKCQVVMARTGRRLRPDVAASARAVLAGH